MTSPASSPLAGKIVALAGHFASMTHGELESLIVELGGRLARRPNFETDWLVVGQHELPLGRDGRPSRPLTIARRLQAAGVPLEIVPEEIFFSRLHRDTSAIHSRYTLVQLSRILQVPAARLRRWVRAGLLVPVDTIHRLAYFDFQQASGAKRLCELLSAGVSLPRLRRSLRAVERWLPDATPSLAQLALLEGRGRVLLRLDDGRLVEPNGQFQLDFETDSLATAIALAPPRSADEWFAAALESEEAGRTHEAIAAYRAAVDLAPDDPVLQFNLGNALYAERDLAAAAAHFQRAVTCDPTYVEAWNNLGNIRAEQGRSVDALVALRRAVELLPSYADAHYNLAETLSDLGRLDEACDHWHAYLACDAASPWAAEVRRRLARVQEQTTEC